MITIAFVGSRRIAIGPVAEVAVAAKAVLDGAEPVLIFDAVTSAPVDVDFRDTDAEVRARLTPLEEARGRGRPKLGVTAREVTLLPRHWDWLAKQRGGASAALRRLVDEGRRQTEAADRIRQGREALYRFMTAMAGDAPGYEDAVRALFAGEAERLGALIQDWPSDVRDHALALGRPAFGHEPSPLDGLVSEDKRAAVDRVLAAAFPGGAVETAERMVWGASGAGVFRLAVSGARCVLRIEGPPNPMRDPVRHYACLRIASEAGVAPRLLQADDAAGVCLTDFIDTGLVGPAKFDERQLLAATKAVKRLHGAPLFPILMPYLDALNGIMGQFGQSGVAAPEVLAAPLNLYARLCAVYPRRDTDLVSSHNDLNPSNLMFQGERALIVDWETGFAADRYVDLAALANWFAADETTEALMLHSYFDAAPGVARSARFLVMRQINRLFYGAMLIGSALAERPDIRLCDGDLTRERFSAIRGDMHQLATAEGRLRFGRAFVAEALHDAETPRFETALKVMSR